MNLTDIQEAAYANAVRKGFIDPDDPSLPWEFSLLHAEVSEAFEAWRKEPTKVGGELADVVIFVAKIAKILGFDLNEEVARKLKVNADRTYTRNEHGNLVKVENTIPMVTFINRDQFVEAKGALSPIVNAMNQLRSITPGDLPAGLRRANSTDTDNNGREGDAR